MSPSLVVLVAIATCVLATTPSKVTKRHLEIVRALPTQEIHVQKLLHPSGAARTSYQSAQSVAYPALADAKMPRLPVTYPGDVGLRVTTSTVMPGGRASAATGRGVSLEEIYPPLQSEEGYYYGVPTVEADHRPTPTELSRLVDILTGERDPVDPARTGRLFYNKPPVLPVVHAYPSLRAAVRPIVVPAYEPQDAVNEELAVKVSDISCYQTPNRAQFRAVLTPNRRFETAPVFENRAPRRCVTPTPSGVDRKYVIDLNDNLGDCGVQQCSADGETRLCVSLRFPTVRGLKLPEDLLVNIQCRTQERVVEQSAQLRVNAVPRVEGRSAPLVAVGGLRYEFQSQMALFKRPPGGGGGGGGSGFTQRMAAGSTVLLGEEIQLRCDIRSGDGWQYSRLGEVTIHRSGQHGETSDDSVVIVAADGCRNPLMKSVCPNHPQRDKLNPLSTSVTWRVFMFQDMREGEEVVVSAHLLGCLESGDCNPDLCLEQPYSRRAKRAVIANRTTDWRADLSFRVVLPKYGQARSGRDGVGTDWLLPALSALIAVALLAVFLVSMVIFKTVAKTSTSVGAQAAEYVNIKSPGRRANE